MTINLNDMVTITKKDIHRRYMFFRMRKHKNKCSQSNSKHEALVSFFSCYLMTEKHKNSLLDWSCFALIKLNRLPSYPSEEMGQSLFGLDNTRPCFFLMFELYDDYAKKRESCHYGLHPKKTMINHNYQAQLLTSLALALTHTHT